MNTFSELKQGQRRSQKKATAVKILNAAKTIFEKEGYEQANIRKIARSAGVAAGSVMNHYGDKRNLLHHALYNDLEKVLNDSLKKARKKGLQEGLSRLTKDVFGYYQKRPKLAKILLKESLFAEEPWAQKFSAQTGKVHQAITVMCENAKQSGEIQKSVDSSIFAVSYLSFFYFNLIAWVQGAATPIQLVDRMIEEYIQFIK